MQRFPLLPPVFSAALLVVCAAATAQTPAMDAHARHGQDREKCMTHNTKDSLATCLREANNALDASRKGDLSNPGAAATNNATQRCAAFQKAADQADCLRRVQSSPASGSVSGGGVLRESTTTTITVPAQQ